MEFVGRKRQLQVLNGLTQKRSASMVVIKGRRRIGKSRLIQEFGKNFTTYTFSGIPPTPDTTRQSQINEFSRQLSENFGISRIPFTDWGDAFTFLASQVQSGKILIVFDKYPGWDPRILISWIKLKICGI